MIAISAVDARGLDSSVHGHFGHSPFFTFLDPESTDSGSALPDGGLERVIVNPYSSHHRPGELPRFLCEQGATVVITGSMGQRAIAMLESRGLKVFTGAEGLVREAFKAYLQGKLSRSAGCSSGGDCSGTGHHP